ncbi:MAG: Spy/CpxP family protein refolding chaperone [Acidobacteria bacterium]|nr:Spy/CpxP family protein refolding chaperone [Acidobacteriota bacterium]
MKDRRRALAVLVALFLVGIVLGAAGSYYWLKPAKDTVRTFEDMRPPPPPKGLERPKYPELNLTPEQQEQHAEIYAEARGKLKEIDEENRERMRERMREQMTNLWKQEDDVWDEAYPKLIAVLNEEQKAEFDQFWAKARDYGHRLRRHRGSEPPKENYRKPERPKSTTPE